MTLLFFAGYLMVKRYSGMSLDILLRPMSASLSFDSKVT